MIKVSYKTETEGLTKPEITKIRITDGRMFVQYSIPRKAESVVKKMREDGKRALYSRGMMIEIFPGKSKKEILNLILEDIKNGTYQAEKETKKILKIKDIEITE